MSQHEEILESALVEALSEVDLDQVALDMAVEPISDAHGDAVSVDEVTTLAAAGFLTSNRGVVVRLSDGTELIVKVSVNRGPSA